MIQGPCLLLIRTSSSFFPPSQLFIFPNFHKLSKIFQPQATTACLPVNVLFSDNDAELEHDHHTLFDLLMGNHSEQQHCHRSSSRHQLQQWRSQGEKQKSPAERVKQQQTTSSCQSTATTTSTGQTASTVVSNAIHQLNLSNFYLYICFKLYSCVIYH